MEPEIQAIKAGDLEALASAYHSYRDRLSRTLQFRMDRRLTTRIDPDDILQEAYMNATTRVEHIDASSNEELFIWFRMILLQTLIDVHRRHLGAQMRDAGREINIRPNDGNHSTSASMMHSIIGSLTTPSQNLRRAEMQETLESALGSMNEIDREVLALRHFEELSNQEIAMALNIEQKAASIRYVRALRRLKEIMDEIPGIDLTEILKR